MAGPAILEDPRSSWTARASIPLRHTRRPRCELQNPLYVRGPKVTKGFLGLGRAPVMVRPLDHRLHSSRARLSRAVASFSCQPSPQRARAASSPLPPAAPRRPTPLRTRPDNPVGRPEGRTAQPRRADPAPTTSLPSPPPTGTGPRERPPARAAPPPTDRLRAARWGRRTFSSLNVRGLREAGTRRASGIRVTALSAHLSGRLIA